MKRVTILAFFFLAFCIILSGCGKKDNGSKEIVGEKNTSNGTNETVVAVKVNPNTGMAEMTATTVAFTLGDMSVTWGELQDYFNSTPVISNAAMGKTDAEFLWNGLEEGQQKAAKQLLEGLVRQLTFAKEAKLSNQDITEEEKQTFAKRWAIAHPGKSIDNYLERIPDVSASRLKLNRSEIFMLLKYTDALIDEIEVPEAMLKSTVARLNQLRGAFEGEMAQRRKDFEAIASNPDLNTDEGFARLAKELSDGIEADNGGVIDGLMTRKEIAECNFGQPFTTELGETSPMIETPTSLRYVRVLEVIPSEQAGGDEKLKVAQILFTKRELEGIPTEAEMVQKLKYNYQDSYLSQKLSELLDKYEFTCPLFPNIRDEWPVAKTKQQNDSLPQQNDNQQQ